MYVFKIANFNFTCITICYKGKPLKTPTFCRHIRKEGD